MRSQAGIDDVREVLTKASRVHRRQAPPSAKEDRSAHRRGPIWSELRHRSTISGYGQTLAGRDAVDDLATSIPQLPDRHLCHAATVSRVRQLRSEDRIVSCGNCRAPGWLQGAGSIRTPATSGVRSTRVCLANRRLTLVVIQEEPR